MYNVIINFARSQGVLGNQKKGEEKKKTEVSVR